MKNKLVKILISLLALLGVYTGGNALLGGGVTDSVTVLDGISATVTSSSINIDGAERVTLAFTIANVTGTGLATSTFAVEVSNDETNWVTYNKLVDNVINSNSQELTRVASEIVDTNGTTFLSMDLQHDNFMFLRMTDTITGTTTSNVTVKALIDR